MRSQTGDHSSALFILDAAVSEVSAVMDVVTCSRLQHPVWRDGQGSLQACSWFSGLNEIY